MTIACVIALLTLAACGKGEVTTSAAGSETQADHPSWQFKTLKDAMTDKVRGIASLESGADTDSVLIFKCDEPGTNSVYVQLSFGQYLGATRDRDELRDVQYRVDGSAPARLISDYSDKYLIVTDENDVKRFAGAVANGKRLVVRAKTYQYSEVDAEFDLRDAATQIRRVAETCKATPLI
ncbi:hypothetical protein [Burkholderia vietnamiensis]|uniref:hypothetical protein n=1 Tax=Burkholderia vietnamiensis TaxID=60552 RepID=UPI001CF34F35|nr:hypothetical protein [Burkholderia vietnamiensis]MCA7945082.1 hypothetical protein [Burkholderia vietnamiensis]